MPNINLSEESSDMDLPPDKFIGILIVIAFFHFFIKKKNKQKTVNHLCQVASPGGRSVSTVNLGKFTSLI